MGTKTAGEPKVGGPRGASVRLVGVHRTFVSPGGRSVEVLRGVDLEIGAGATAAVVGPSGSGKSTLLALIGALDRSDAGTIRVGDDDLGRLDERERERWRARTVGFVFQRHGLLPQLTALENVLVPAWARDTSGAALDEARRLLARVGLADRAEHFPAQLSGGECQRVALARALLPRPALLLADEPTGALDHVGAAVLGDLLLALNAEAGTTLIVVTHAEALARRMQRRLRLCDGVLHDDGPGGA